MSKTLIIAEVGECFNGDIQEAKKLIRVAREAGCDIVKFQTLDYANISPDDPEKEWFKKIALTPLVIEELITNAKDIGIDILFTPENAKTAQWIINCGLSDMKIASSCIVNKELVNYIKSLNLKRIFVSTGMASLDEVNEIVDSFKGIPEIFLLHCISEYPTGPLLDKRGLRALSHDNVNLQMMKILELLFPQCKVGYSDHTVGLLAPIVAVAMGAKVIEKHITLDREGPIALFSSPNDYSGTDHVLSLEPDELQEMVANIREVEKIMGEWKWDRTDGEKILRRFLRERFVDVNNHM